jgi:hypothetical protein
MLRLPKSMVHVESSYPSVFLLCQPIIASDGNSHGGRQLDSAPPALATLVKLRQQRPDLLDDKDFEVYLDGGVRRGADVVKGKSAVSGSLSV